MGKNYFPIRQILTAGILLATLPCFAFPLATYRKQIGTEVTASEAARARVKELRDRLGFGQLHLDDPEGLFVPALRADNGTKDLSSLLFNRFFWGATSLLKKNELQQKTIVFDPSWDIERARSAKKKARDAYCHAKLTPTFEALIDPFLSYLHRQQARMDAEESSAIPGTEIERKRTALLKKYLEANEPKIKGIRKIETVFGPLSNVEVVDGKMHRLLFALPNGEGIFPVSLAMLLNFRTQRDEYFVAALDCFAEYLLKLKDDKKASAQRRIQAGALVELGAKKFAGAARASRILHSLLIVRPNGKIDTQRLDFLLDLLLQLRGEDVPLAEEMVATEDGTKQAKTLADLFYEQLPKFSGKTVPPHRQRVERDYYYYDQLHDQLFELKNRLQEEAVKKQALERLIGDLS